MCVGLAGQHGEEEREEKQGVCAEVFLAQWAAQRGRGRSNNNDEETALLRGAKGHEGEPSSREATRLCYQRRESYITSYSVWTPNIVPSPGTTCPKRRWANMVRDMYIYIYIYI